MAVVLGKKIHEKSARLASEQVRLGSLNPAASATPGCGSENEFRETSHPRED